MTEKTNIIQILPKESILSSIIKDTYSIFLLGGLFYFNEKYIGGSYFVNFIVLAGIIIYAVRPTKDCHKATDLQINKIKSILNNDKSN
ncbi:MAG: hypothetical protein KA100_06920 [Rickettsiales bacterium]|nr:hypothetical protein [Rickettsiales bacterium]